MHAEIKQTEEFATLSKQHESKRFYIFCHHVFHLKNILKCSICLEIYDSPVELSECKHLFCQDCIDVYSGYTNGKSTCCPICQKRFQKNDYNDHFFFKKLSEFTRYVLKHIYIVLGEKCNKLPSYVQVHQLWEQNSHLNEIFKSIKNIFESAVTEIKDSVVLDNHKILLEANKKYSSNTEKVTEESSAFDALLKTPVQNKFFKQKPFIDSKVYIVKKSEKENTNPEHIHNVQQFENESNKTEILKWLENTNNEFDYKSFTQVHKIAQDIPDFDMPSISQTIAFKKPNFNASTNSELKKHKQMQNEMREKSNVLLRLSRSVQSVNNKRNGQEKRTRSLECCLKTIIPQPRVKRHSLPVFSEDEVIVIEQFDSEKDILHKKDPDKLALVNLMETEYLNAIDNELIVSKRDSRIGKRKKSVLRNSDQKAESNLNVSRGWNRVKAVKKTFAKTEKRSSKLKVISLATSANTVNQIQTNLRSKANIRNTPPKIVQTVEPSKKEESKIVENVEPSKKEEPRTFPLNEVELYFNNTIRNLTAQLSKENIQPPINEKVTNVEESQRNEIESSNNVNTRSRKKYKDVSLKKKNVKEKQNEVEKQLITEAKENAQSNGNVEVCVNNLFIAKESNEHNYKFDEEAHSAIKTNTKEKLQIGSSLQMDGSRASVDVEDKQSVLQLNDVEVAGAIVADKALQDDTSCNNIVGNKKKIKTAPHFETIVTHAIIENRDLQEPFPTISNDADNIQNCVIGSSVEEKCQKPQLETSTIGNIEEIMSKIHEVEIIDKVDREMDCPKPVDFVNNVHPEAEDDDFIFTLPTQTIISSDIKQVNDNCMVNQLNNKIMSIHNILSVYLDDPSLKNTSLMCKLKEVLNEKHLHKSPCKEMKNTYVQTISDTCIVNPEDDSPESHYKDMGIQTDSFDTSHGFKISSTDMFNIQPVVSTAVQTEQLVCINCNHNVCNSLVAAQNKASSSVFKEDNFENDIARKYSLSASFDNLTFETQDVVRGEQICLKSTTKSITSQSFAKDETNKQSQVGKESTNCKRVRQSSSDDSDNEKVKINATKKHKIDNDVLTESENVIKRPQLATNLLENNDISLEFLSDLDTNLKEASQLHKEIHNSIKPEEPSNYHQAATKSDTKVLTDVFEEPFPKRVKTQDIIKECEMIIKEACSTTLRIDHTHYGTEAIKLSLDGLEEEFNRDFEDDGNNIFINNQRCSNTFNNNKNAKDRCSESIFSSAENKISQVDKQNEKVDHLEGLEECFVDEYDKELQSFTQRMLKKDAKKIHVIQDILLPKPTNSHLEKVIEDKDEAEIFVDNASEKSDEIIDSDQDVIETTPQKSRVEPPPLEAVSQACYNPQEKILLQNNYFIPDEIIRAPEDNPLSCLNETFTPPPEFQDPDIDIIEPQNHNDIEDIAPNASITPDLLIHDTDARGQYAQLITSTPFSCVSQTLTSKTWNLSPIRSPHTYVNPILAAQNASRLPVTIIECKTPPKVCVRPIVTNTPKQKSILNYIQPGDKTREKNSILKPNEMSSINVPVNSKPNVCYTRLSTNQIMQVTSLATKKLITITNTFGTTVTHMIVAVNRRNYLQDHTMKYVLAVAAGIWVLNFKWIEECLKQHEVVPEEPYEALDITGSDGPRRSRLTRSIAPLLENYKIYVAPPFRSTTKTEIETVIKLLGGEVMSKPEDLLKKKGKVCLIVTESSASQEDDLFEEWLEKLKVITVDLEWLSRSVGRFQTSRLRPFALCSEESFSDLSYPAELLEDGPYSFTAKTES